ncbi:Calcineurin-like phosphoesterase [Paenibacillus sp. UNCCL117]|uniref:metallophosphoesterase family protein n=1 Tax=unclassified Paenibacillus TaxID=185978 RepID=UPI000887328E|nr:MULTISPECIES: metallophosphoesterase [unclassified Paenibacillus]SDC37308.1 Calcineurin-like phosphoesterase [Paenibacillus sp. cl123]SFW14740.1 Calcineurin-like phosphoesterase [Paenibacillus sp. UNCCL117]
MSRFIYVTDTHIGASPPGFRQQPPYPQLMGELLAALGDEIRRHRAEFVLHGGDLIHGCSVEMIQQAYADCRSLPVPVRLCLGNHDISRSEALSLWLEQAPDLFVGSSADYCFVEENYVVHVLANHWDRSEPYIWKGALDPHLSEEQVETLERNLRKHPDKPHLLAVHNPVYGMPVEQSGLPHEIHAVPASFREPLVDMMERYPQLKLVLSGHNHLNTMKRSPHGAYISTSAFVEAPFEYKLIEVTDMFIKVSTRRVPLPAAIATSIEYDESRSYAQGRKQDRELLIPLTEG